MVLPKEHQLLYPTRAHPIKVYWPCDRGGPRTMGKEKVYKGGLKH